MTIKIVFSDGTVHFLKTADTALCNQLKDANSDKSINEVLKKFEVNISANQEADANEVQCTVDMLKKKQSAVKRMKKAFGGISES